MPQRDLTWQVDGSSVLEGSTAACGVMNMFQLTSVLAQMMQEVTVNS